MGRQLRYHLFSEARLRVDRRCAHCAIVALKHCKFLSSWRVVAVLTALAVPAVAHAQSAISGVVVDSSGAVLPGVSVEAESPALIEKVRTTVTNGQGLYTLADLRPGLYVVRFSLTGF